MFLRKSRHPYINTLFMGLQLKTKVVIHMKFKITNNSLTFSNVIKYKGGRFVLTRTKIFMNGCVKQFIKLDEFKCRKNNTYHITDKY